MNTYDGVLRIKAFGALEIRSGDTWKRISSRQERSLLACLLLEPNRIVPTGKIIDALWNDESPIRPQKVLGTYVSRIRRWLEGTQLQIEYHGGGYQVVIEPDQCDLHIFEKDCATGLRAFEDGDTERAVKLLNRGLSLWRGAPFADVTPTGQIDLAVDHLTEIRLNAVEVKTQAVMIDSVAAMNFKAVGSLVAQLRQLLAQTPLRERLWCLLIEALYLAGRPAEAIHAYFSCRTTLMEELGVEPGLELRMLHQEILTDTFDVDKLSHRRLPVRVAK